MVKTLRDERNIRVTLSFIAIWYGVDSNINWKKQTQNCTSNDTTSAEEDETHLNRIPRYNFPVLFKLEP